MPIIEPVIRPPSEAYSLILQATIGCSWNRCSFCVAFQEKEYREKRDILINAFYKIGLETNIPKATFYLWQKAENKTGAEFAKQLLKECGILVSPGEIFATTNEGINPGNDYVRVALVPSIEKTKEAAKRIIDAKIW